ncbi:Carbonic anhydrase or acetyltransferase, isoleucine patch superfamily [Thermosyntropha lipolytica DSM 11003]|uniref:Carbonic anhydrase or acetyltransferase, isoleucine patch superfamily n=1 Tax=Thermosyntropha lipolytica DSM 11003 TaxID=1123382 RepID=A0A1M5PQH8_9FIRM|nr:transferase [Thermosyntropha lipolytica]SHH03921.1 Carbonic anhydrase or acetyltransferase, isoleucine patch superfamily [Thermosyntropha lipolytica DSM 11003]
MSENLRLNPQGDKPVIDPSSYVDPTAVIIGPVTIGKNCYIGPHTVIRADEVDEKTGKVAPVIIGDNVNLQDGVIIHALAGTSVEVGSNTSLAHGCVVHGPCKIEAGCFIGFRAVVFKTVIGSGSMVKHGAIVEGVNIPSGKLVPTGEIITSEDHLVKLKEVGQAEKEFMQEVVHVNMELAHGYKK